MEINDLVVGERNEIQQYFKNKAARYDEVDSQVYWQLSDALLWDILVSQVLSKMPHNFTFLDAGAGTGRWSKKILDQYPTSSATLLDISPHMLEEARKKLSSETYNNRYAIIEADLNSLPTEQLKKYDLILSFHNVLGFVESPSGVIEGLSSLLKANGAMAFVLPNIYHAVFFNLTMGRLSEAEICVKNQKGRFTSDMPYIHMFSPETLNADLASCGLDDIKTFGFPISLYPGYQETQISGSTTTLSTLLNNQNSFNALLQIEKLLCYNDNISARGNNLFSIGWRR